MGGNIYSNGGTVTLNSGIVKDGSTVTTQTNDATRGGNIGLDNATLYIHDGATVSGGFVGTYINKNGNSAESFGGGNIYVANATVNMDGGIVKDGGTTSSGGGNFSSKTGAPVINITGGTVENGYSKYSSCGNFYFAYISTGTLNVSGGTIDKGTGTDASGKYYGGMWADWYNYNGTPKSSTINLTGNPTINDKAGCAAGSKIEIKKFTGTAGCSVASDRVISDAWDADYIESGKVTLIDGYTHNYNNGVVTILKQSHVDNAAIVADVNSKNGEVHLADRDAILDYGTYNSAATDVFEANGEFENLDEMTAQAEDYDAMMETKVEVRENFGADGDKVLYVIYSSMDEANIAEYDYAQIILTINGVTKGNDATLDQITDVYRTVNYNGVKAASADDYTYDTANGHSDKSDYVYYTTLSLSAANAARTDVTFDFYARIYLVGGGYVDGTHVTGKLADLLS